MHIIQIAYLHSRKKCDFCHKLLFCEKTVRDMQRLLSFSKSAYIENIKNSYNSSNIEKCAAYCNHYNYFITLTLFLTTKIISKIKLSRMLSFLKFIVFLGKNLRMRNVKDVGNLLERFVWKIPHFIPSKGGIVCL